MSLSARVMLMTDDQVRGYLADLIERASPDERRVLYYCALRWIALGPSCGYPRRFLDGTDTRDDRLEEGDELSDALFYYSKRVLTEAARRAPRVHDESYEPARNGPGLRELEDALGLVMGDAMPETNALASLTMAERDAVIDWAGKVHFEASDNDLGDDAPGAAPECLRRLLPDDHFYKAWRTNEGETP